MGSFGQYIVNRIAPEATSVTGPARANSSNFYRSRGWPSCHHNRCWPPLTRGDRPQHLRPSPTQLPTAVHSQLSPELLPCLSSLLKDTLYSHMPPVPMTPPLGGCHTYIPCLYTHLIQKGYLRLPTNTAMCRDRSCTLCCPGINIFKKKKKNVGKFLHAEWAN